VAAIALYVVSPLIDFVVVLFTDVFAALHAPVAVVTGLVVVVFSSVDFFLASVAVVVSPDIVEDLIVSAVFLLLMLSLLLLPFRGFIEFLLLLPVLMVLF